VTGREKAIFLFQYEAVYIMWLMEYRVRQKCKTYEI